jgi:hypothetical protein
VGYNKSVTGTEKKLRRTTVSITWTSNGNVWLALHGDQWAKIQRVEDHDCPYDAYIGIIESLKTLSSRINYPINTDRWYVGNKKFGTLEQAQAWAAEKLGIKS